MVMRMARALTMDSQFDAALAIVEEQLQASNLQDQATTALQAQLQLQRAHLHLLRCDNPAASAALKVVSSLLTAPGAVGHDATLITHLQLHYTAMSLLCDLQYGRVHLYQPAGATNHVVVAQTLSYHRTLLQCKLAFVAW